MKKVLRRILSSICHVTILPTTHFSDEHALPHILSKLSAMSFRRISVSTVSHLRLLSVAIELIVQHIQDLLLPSNERRTKTRQRTVSETLVSRPH